MQPDASTDRECGGAQADGAVPGAGSEAGIPGSGGKERACCAHHAGLRCALYLK